MQGEADFSDTPVRGRLNTYVVAKEGGYPMGGVNDGTPAVLFNIPSSGKVTSRDVEAVKSHCDMIPNQDFVDVPMSEFRTRDRRLNVDELVMGLNVTTPDPLKKRWVEMFEDFVEIRE